MAGEIGSFAAQEGFLRGPNFEVRISSSEFGADTPTRAAEKEQRHKVAQEFAAMLLFEVIKAMRATIPQGGLFEQDSLSHDIYTAIGDMGVARAMARNGAMGLGKLVERSLEAAGRPPSVISLEQSAARRYQVQLK